MPLKSLNEQPRIKLLEMDARMVTFNINNFKGNCLGQLC